MPVGRIDYEGAAPGLEQPLLEDGDDGERHRRRPAFAALGLLLAGALLAVLVWKSTGSPSPVTHVRYVNDTGTRVVVTPCGAKQRCIIEAGASAEQNAADANAVSWPSSTRVLNARTQRLVGCLPYLADGTVRLSDADIGPVC